MFLHPLDRKLLRDLWRLRTQALAIALIIASGVGVLCSSLAVVDALSQTTDAFYDRYRFANVFASATRAPLHVVSKIEDINGVQSVQARVVELATLDVEGFDEPIIGTLVSIPENTGPTLNQLHLRMGSLPSRDRPGDIVLSESFAQSHALRVGDSIGALINGRRRVLEVVGIALSPEFVYSIGPGALMPDAKRYSIGWMGQTSLRAAFDLEGAFNDVSMTLAANANAETVIRRLDDLLAPYGGTGAFERKDQISNWFLMNEISQLRSMAGVLPTIFLAVAAFLGNMVLSRLIATERSEIGLIKAFGYSNFAVAWHYSKLASAMAGTGIVVGWALGWWLGRWTTELYAELYRFPILLYDPGPQPFIIAAAVSLVATLFGTLSSVRRAGALPPAEAMRPPAPPAYRRAGVLSDVLENAVEQLTRIVLRQLVRWPFRALLTSLGVAAATAVLIMSLQWIDAVQFMIDSFFFDQQRQDVTVVLVDEQPLRAKNDLSRLPGVLALEAQRNVAARLHHGRYTRRQGVVGIAETTTLEVLKDASGDTITIPPDGLVVARSLAERLHVRPGDSVTLELLEGKRTRVSVPVAAVFDTWIGTPAYMHRDALNRLLGESSVINTVLLRVDNNQLPELFRALKATPVVGQVSLRAAAVENFNDTIGEHLYVFIGIYLAFSSTLAVGVVYNSMRISLSERGRELATLRVLGFHNAEVSYVLLGEAALLVLLALPVGCWLGLILIRYMASNFDTELFRIPVTVLASTYGISMLVTLLAAVTCGVLVHRRIAHLDLIRVLKTRE